mmetsp:Transcript_13332/g.20233  ORF Transcript_13332/g.20233 Transcript_13332/m.20233 type:complete len:329 (-) Transcript_13332:141-1127(-)
MWGIFVWSVLPPGALFVLLLTSGNSLALRVASRVLSTPVRISGFQLSLASFVSAICFVLMACSYLSFRTAEDRVLHMKDSGLVSGDRSLQTSSFYWGRNFYMTMLGLVLWATAWRLKTLVDQNQLCPPRKPDQPIPTYKRALYLLLGVSLMVLADIPLCRINYNLQLAWYVTPVKNDLTNKFAASSCRNAMFANAEGDCAGLCMKVKKLSDERLATIMSARGQHLLGSAAAQFFDGARGTEQGAGRIEDLFEKKTCMKVLESVDKSNNMVNIFCAICSVLCVIGFFSCFSIVLTGSDSMPQPSAPWAPGPPPPGAEIFADQASNKKGD